MNAPLDEFWVRSPLDAPPPPLETHYFETCGRGEYGERPVVGLRLTSFVSRDTPSARSALAIRGGGANSTLSRGARPKQPTCHLPVSTRTAHSVVLASLVSLPRLPLLQCYPCATRTCLAVFLDPTCQDSPLVGTTRAPPSAERRAIGGLNLGTYVSTAVHA